MNEESKHNFHEQYKQTNEKSLSKEKVFGKKPSYVNESKGYLREKEQKREGELEMNTKSLSFLPRYR